MLFARRRTGLPAKAKTKRHEPTDNEVPSAIVSSARLNCRTFMSMVQGPTSTTRRTAKQVLLSRTLWNGFLCLKTDRGRMGDRCLAQTRKLHVGQFARYHINYKPGLQGTEEAASGCASRCSGLRRTPFPVPGVAGPLVRASASPCDG